MLDLRILLSISEEFNFRYADATADFSVCNRNEALSVNEKVLILTILPISLFLFQFSYRFRAGLVNSGYAGIYPWNDLLDARKV